MRDIIAILKMGYSLPFLIPIFTYTMIKVVKELRSNDMTDANRLIELKDEIVGSIMDLESEGYFWSTLFWVALTVFLMVG